MHPSPPNDFPLNFPRKPPEAGPGPSPANATAAFLLPQSWTTTAEPGMAETEETGSISALQRRKLQAIMAWSWRQSRNWKMKRRAVALGEGGASGRRIQSGPITSFNRNTFHLSMAMVRRLDVFAQVRELQRGYHVCYKGACPGRRNTLTNTQSTQRTLSFLGEPCTVHTPING